MVVFYKNYRIEYLLILSTLLISNGFTQDISRRRTSNICKEHGDCPTFAYCDFNISPIDNGICACREGFIIVTSNKTRECLKVANRLHDDCTFDEQCMYTLSTEAECRNHQCQCREGTHYIRRENACYKSVMVGDWCRLTNNCIGENTVCRSGVCQCPPGSHSNAQYSSCVNDLNLGDKCTSDDECVTPNSRCHDICRCRVSHIISEDKQRCLRIADKIFNSCEEDNQCQFHIPHSVCGNNYTCVCKDGYHEKNYQCWVTVGIDGICEENENCIPTMGVLCQNGRCECANNLQFIDGKCSSGVKQYIISFPLKIFIMIFSISKILF